MEMLKLSIFNGIRSIVIISRMENYQNRDFNGDEEDSFQGTLEFVAGQRRISPESGKRQDDVSTREDNTGKDKHVPFLEEDLHVRRVFGRELNTDEAISEMNDE